MRSGLRFLAPLLCLPVFAQQPARLNISAPVTQLISGQQVQLAATARAANGTVMPSAAITWTSNNTNVARVGADGTVTAAGLGIAQVFAQSGNVRSSNLELQVLPLRIDLEPSYTELTVGESLQLTATARDIHGEPIPNIEFNWQWTGANGGQINAATMNRTGRLEALGVGRITVRARFGYGGAPSRVEWVWGTATVLIGPRRDYRIRRLLSNDDVRHSFQMRGRPQSQVVFNDAGQAAFAANLDGLAGGLLLYDNGQFRVVAGAGQSYFLPGADGGSFGLTDAPNQVAINSRGDVLTRFWAHPGKEVIILYSGGSSRLLLPGGSSFGEIESLRGFSIRRSSLSDSGEVLFLSGYRLQSAPATPQQGLFRLVGRSLDPVSLSHLPPPGITGLFFYSEFGMDNEGTVYFTAVSNDTNRAVLYRRQGFDAPARILGAGDSLGNSRIRTVRNLAVARSGGAACEVELEDNSRQLVRLSGEQRATLPFQGGGGTIFFDAAGTGVLFNNCAPQGCGLFQWLGSTVRPLLMTGALAPNGEPIRILFDARLTPGGELYAHVATAERDSVVMRAGSPGRVLLQTGSRIDVTLNVRLLWNSTLVPGLVSGPLLVRLGDPPSIFELDGVSLRPVLMSGDRLPDGTLVELAFVTGNASGDLYVGHRNGDAIQRLSSGRIETLVRRNAELEPGVFAQHLTLWAASDRGAVILSAGTSQQDTRWYLWDAGTLTPLWRTGQPLAGISFNQWDFPAIDESGRILMRLRNSGQIAGTVMYAGGRWTLVPDVLGLPPTGQYLARGNSFYLAGSVPVPGGDQILAELGDQGWRPLLATVHQSMPDGGELRHFGAFGVNRRGEIAVVGGRGPVNLLMVMAGESVRAVQPNYTPLDGGEYLMGFNELQLRDDGKVYFVAVDDSGRHSLYVAEPVN